MSVKIEGLEAVIDRLDDITDQRELTIALMRCCALVERSAKQKAPKGTGELRNSISSKVEGNTGIVFTPLEYAPYVEYGTGLFAENGDGRQEVPWVYVEGNATSDRAKSKKIYTEEEAIQTVAFLRSKGLDAHMTSGEHPQPFMRPALIENRKEILRTLKEGLLDD